MAKVIVGKASGDQLNANSDKTQIYGLKGNDTLTSDNHSDVLLVGGSGNDRLILKGGNGTLNGGKGSDTFELNYSATQPLSAVIEDIEPASDKIVVNFDGDTAPQLSIVASGEDVILTDSAGLINVTLKGVRENDYFDGDASDEAWEVLELTNAEREKQNLSPLTMSDGLTEGASIRAEEITGLGASGALNDHRRPNGSPYYTVLVDGKLSLREKYTSENESIPSDGENLDSGAESPAEVMQEWINSASHYANIMRSNFKKLGVGYNRYDEDPTDRIHYWTQLFADSLKSPETIGTAELLRTSIKIGTLSTLITLSDNADIYNNTIFSATIAGLDGNDRISNSIANVSISGGEGNDTLNSGGINVTINGGIGNDRISLSSNAQENLIQYTAGDGSDTITGFNSTSTLSISGNEYTPVTVGNNVVVSVGDDSITLQRATGLSSVNIDGRRSKVYIGTENTETINNTVDGATIQALGGNDQINLTGKAQTVLYTAGDGSDTITGFNATSTLSISGNEYTPVTVGNNVVVAVGNDSITLQRAADLSSVNIRGRRSKLYIGTENSETLNVAADNATINALEGNDLINLTGRSQTILYTSGDGADTITGFNTTSTLKIGDGTGTYSTQASGNDISINVGTGSILLKNTARLTSINIDGTESIIGGDDSSSTITPEESKLITLTNGNDNYKNTVEGATIQALGGNDSIQNGEFNSYICSNVSINSGEGDDSIANFDGFWTTIDGGWGNDLIRSYGCDVKPLE